MTVKDNCAQAHFDSAWGPIGHSSSSVAYTRIHACNGLGCHHALSRTVVMAQAQVRLTLVVGVSIRQQSVDNRADIGAIAAGSGLPHPALSRSTLYCVRGSSDTGVIEP